MTAQQRTLAERVAERLGAASGSFNFGGQAKLRAALPALAEFVLAADEASLYERNVGGGARYDAALYAIAAALGVEP